MKIRQMRMWKHGVIYVSLFCVLLGLLSVCAPVTYAEGTPAIQKIAEGDTVSWELTVEQAGDYELTFSYMVDASQIVNPQIALAITDVCTNFNMELPLVWKIADSSLEGKRFVRDEADNEMLPLSVRAEEWQTITILPISGKENLPLQAGTYVVTMKMSRGSIEAYAPQFKRYDSLPDYAQYRQSCEQKAASGKASGINRRIEAELYSRKSALEICSSYNLSDYLVSPSKAGAMRYNLLGGAQFGQEGQWVSWELDVPEDGYYHIGFTYRHSTESGLPTHCAFRLDDELLFEEMRSCKLPYQDRFSEYTLADEENEPYAFYLEKGKHTLTMQIVLTGLHATVAELEQTVGLLNKLYSSMVIIVGETPDAYRDYDLFTSIPNLKADLQTAVEQLQKLRGALEADGGQSGSSTAALDEAARFINKLLGEPRKVSGEIKNLQTQIYTLADVSNSLRKQPLELDYVTLSSADVQSEKVEKNFWKWLSHRFVSFFSSFQKDYTTTTDADSHIKVWVCSNAATSGFLTGLDQAQIVRRLTTDYTKETGTAVNLSLITSSETLLSALVSGSGPDVALFVPDSTIANLYYRKGVLALNDMPNFEKIHQRFYPSSLVSLQFDEKLFALPEVQSIYVMYYRKDVLQEQGLTVPNTWSEFYSALSSLQRKGYQIGLSQDTQAFEMFLLQNGGTLYNEDLTNVTLDTKAAVEAFCSWTDLYVKHGIPVTADYLSRFRAGTMPIVVSPTYFYGQLVVGAPELTNLWGVAPIPGTIDADGTPKRAQSCLVTGSIILSGTQHREQAQAYLEWWTRTEVQNRFASENESTLGISSRYYSANPQVNAAIPWTADEKDVVLSAWAQAQDTPLSVVNYSVTRNLTNAFRRVVYNYENPRDVITRYADDIYQELIRKNRELGLR